MTAGLVGAALAALLIAVVRRSAPKVERRLLAVGLAVAALVYVLFVLRSAAAGEELGGRWLAIELAGLALFGVAAWRGRASWAWVALGWAAHVAWDVLLHGADTAFVPAGYPALCVGFDLAVAGYAAYRWRAAPR